MTTLRVAWGWLREAALLTAALVTLCAVLAWVQIRQMLIFHGGRVAAQIAAREFPLLHRVAEQLGGWANLTHMGTEEIDRCFPAAFNGVARDWAVEGGAELLRVEAGERRALLGASRGPGSVRTATLRIDGSAPARKESVPLRLSEARTVWAEEDDAA